MKMKEVNKQLPFTKQQSKNGILQTRTEATVYKYSVDWKISNKLSSNESFNKRDQVFWVCNLSNLLGSTWMFFREYSNLL